MATTILDGAVNADDNTPGVRTIAATADGTLWTAFHDDTATAGIRFFYSTDDGGTWTENTSLKIETANEEVAFDINAVRDIAVVWIANLYPYIIVGLTTSSTTWTEATDAATIAAPSDMCVFDKPGSTNFFVAGYQYSSFFGYDVVGVQEYTVAAAYVGDGGGWPSASRGALPKSGAIDFNNSGDGASVAGSAPHLYCAYINSSAGNELKFTKLSYSGGSWTAGTERELDGSDFGTTARAACVFDGTRAIIAAELSNDVYLFERDAGDTTTTSRTADFPATTAVAEVRLSHQASTGFTVWVADVTGDDIDYAQFTRSGASWGSLTELDNYASGLNSEGFSWMRTINANSVIAGRWLVDDGSNFDIDANTVSFNTAPTAPTWTSPADNSAADVGSALTLDWAFNDPDAGDTQSAYALQRVVDGGSVEWWSVAGGTWTTETKNTSGTSALTLSSSWGTDEESHVFKVKTYDSQDAVSPLSDGLTIIASTPVAPTLTAPAASATLTGPTAACTWTVAEQTAYQIRILTSADALLYSTGKITSTATSASLTGYNLANGLTNIKFELTTYNTQGLASTTTNASIGVTYTAPLTPVLTVTAVPASGYISIAVADPTPSGTPQISYHDLYVRVATGGRADLERPVAGDGIRISTGTIVEDGTYLDYAAGSGTSYEYRVLGVSTTGATAYSAWT